MRQVQPMGSPAISLFDRRAWRLHRDRAAGGADLLHREVAERLVDRLDLVNRDFPIVADLGARDGMLARALAERTGTRLVLAVEPPARLLAAAPGPRVCADPEY